MPYVNFEDSKIYYDIHGSGEPVLLLHGFLENSSMWNDYAKELSSTRQIIRVDLPGHGKSENIEVHSMDKMAEAVLLVLAFFKIEKVKIIGHSMGGYVALAIADKTSNIAEGILLFFSSASADTIEKRENRDRLKVIARNDKQGFMRHAIPMLFTKETRQNFASELDEVIKEAQALNTQGIIKTLDGLKTRPNRQHLLQSNISISFVSGNLDEAIPMKTLKTQHSAKAVKKVWRTENGHMGHIEDRDFCLIAIQKFMA
jgi:pimeloyl-ACP methyl ester carboxylesterase